MQLGKVKVEMPTISVGIPFAYLHQPLVGPFKCKHKRNVYAFFMSYSVVINLNFLCMKRILLIALAMITIIGCSKKEDDKPAFTQEQLEGRWKWVDERLPDGKLFSQILPTQEYRSRLNRTFITVRGNTASIAPGGKTYSGTYKLIGSTVQISAEGETHNMYEIVKVTKENLELKYHKDFIQEIKKEYDRSTLPGYSLDQVLNAVEIYEKID